MLRAHVAPGYPNLAPQFRPPPLYVMLKDSVVVATIAVKDTERARKFYEQVLGLLREQSGEPGVLVYKCGGAKLIVYPSHFAGTNKATSATWEVQDVEAEVVALKGRGVTFEHYDMPGVTRKGDVHLTGRTRAAWFKDPDGNILAIVGS
jgi:catechol 2,3-dioxygenase-like lactoylglutathione lyase family enzyme